MSFFDKAKEIIERKRDLITVFEELDRTGTFRKPVYKKRVNFTIDEELFNRFRNYCKKKGINMSAKMENYIREEISK